MPDRQDDLNPASDLAPFADALKRLAPQPPHLSRDALLFEAGKAAGAPRTAPWVWPGTAVGFAALSVVLAAFLISPGSGQTVVYQDRFVYVPTPATHEPPPSESQSTPSAVATNDKKRSDPEASETARLLRQRRDVLRWGVDMLPESKPSAGGPSPDVTAREVTHWLNLPPGTFALPATLPKKPATKNGDGE
jgi:hypothetical protein